MSTDNVINHKIKEDIYAKVCRESKKLCPRLVLSPLWRLSLASITRMAPQTALAISDEGDAVI